MQWNGTKLAKVEIMSNLGGNLRLRVPNALQLRKGGALKNASGHNTNPFYYTESTPAPRISNKANGAALTLKETLLYDIPTQPGKVYTLEAP